jgi:hypothetical protein
MSEPELMFTRRSPGSNCTTRIIFPRLRNHFYGVKMLKFFDADPESGMEKFGSGMEKIRIRDKHPESATLTVRTFSYVF